MQVSRRYADALMNLAQDSKSVDDVQANVESLKTMLEASGDLRAMIASPIFSREQQERAIVAIAKKAKFNKIFVDFLALMARQRRLPLLPSVLKALTAAHKAIKGTEEAEIISASVLSDKETAALKAALSKQLGKDVTVSVRVDESLLGGVIIKLGSRMIDDSVRTRLERLERTLRGGKAHSNSTQNLKEVG